VAERAAEATGEEERAAVAREEERAAEAAKGEEERAAEAAKGEAAQEEEVGGTVAVAGTSWSARKRQAVARVAVAAAVAAARVAAARVAAEARWTRKAPLRVPARVPSASVPRHSRCESAAAGSTAVGAGADRKSRNLSSSPSRRS
jgi:hypothetical protein